MGKLFSNKWIYYIEKHRVPSSVIKMVFFAHGGISIKLFVLYLHIINESVSYKFHPYSILTGHIKVESMAYQVLKKVFWHMQIQGELQDVAVLKNPRIVYNEYISKLRFQILHSNSHTVFLHIVAAATVLFWKLECGY